MQQQRTSKFKTENFSITFVTTNIIPKQFQELKSDTKIIFQYHKIKKIERQKKIFTNSFKNKKFCLMRNDYIDKFEG